MTFCKLKCFSLFFWWELIWFEVIFLFARNPLWWCNMNLYKFILFFPIRSRLWLKQSSKLSTLKTWPVFFWNANFAVVQAFTIVGQLFTTAGMRTVPLLSIVLWVKTEWEEDSALIREAASFGDTACYCNRYLPSCCASALTNVKTKSCDASFALSSLCPNCPAAAAGMADLTKCARFSAPFLPPSRFEEATDAHWQVERVWQKMPSVVI